MSKTQEAIIWGLLEDPHPYPYNDLPGSPWVIRCKLSIGDVVVNTVLVYPNSELPLRLFKHFEDDPMVGIITELPQGSEVYNYKKRMN